MDELDALAEVDVLVKNATSSMKFSTDWESIMDVVDYANNNMGDCRAIAASIEERLKSPKETTVNHCFDLMEALLKNIYEFCALFGSQEFQAQIQAVARNSKGLPDASQRALDFSQFYANAFAMVPMLFYGATYNKLAQSGYKFPQPRSETFVAPLPKEPPNRRLKPHHAPLPPPVAQPAQPRQQNPEPPRPIDPKKLKTELVTINETISLVQEMFASLGPNDKIKDAELLMEEIVPKAKYMTNRMVSIIENSAATLDEDLLADLLVANDSLGEVLKKIDERKTSEASNIRPVAPPGPAPIGGTANPILEPIEPTRLHVKAAAERSGSGSGDLQINRRQKKAPASAIDDLLGLNTLQIESTLPQQVQPSKLSPPPVSNMAQATPATQATASDDPFDEFSAMAKRKRPMSGLIAAPVSSSHTNEPRAAFNPFAPQPPAYNPFAAPQAYPPANPTPVNPLTSSNPFADLLFSDKSTAPAPTPTQTNQAGNANGSSGGDLIQW